MNEYDDLQWPSAPDLCRKTAERKLLPVETETGATEVSGKMVEVVATEKKTQLGKYSGREGFSNQGGPIMEP